MRIRRALTTLLMIVAALPAAAAEMLVSTDWLAKRLNDAGVVVVDMSGDYTQYQRFHIPGAVHLPYQAIVGRTRQGVALAVDAGRFQQVLGLLGITAESHVVIYDDMGGLNAARLYWQLEQVGHKEASIVDGGLVKWIREGRPVNGEEVQPVRTRYAAVSERRDNLAELAEVRAATGDKVLLLDARGVEEYQGDAKMKRSGHIPGARSYPWDESVDFAAGFVAKEDQTLRAQLAKAGLGDDKARPIITYCRSGHRAATSTSPSNASATVTSNSTTARWPNMRCSRARRLRSVRGPKEALIKSALP